VKDKKEVNLQIKMKEGLLLKLQEKMEENEQMMEEQ
jgi:hypothetical protein